MVDNHVIWGLAKLGNHQAQQEKAQLVPYDASDKRDDARDAAADLEPPLLLLHKDDIHEDHSALSTATLQKKKKKKKPLSEFRSADGSELDETASSRMIIARAPRRNLARDSRRESVGRGARGLAR